MNIESVISTEMDINNIQTITCDKYLVSPACDSTNIQSLLQSKIQNTKVYLENSDNSLIVGQNCLFDDCGFYVTGKNNKIDIGSNCKLRGIYFVILGDNNTVVIGDDTTTNGLFWGHDFIHCIEGHTIKIGTDCMLSGGVVIRNSDGHSILVNNERINLATDINIGNHTWIGMRATLLKGANIGSNSIIGANSVVTKTFGNNMIITGNPAVSREIDGTWVREIL